MDRNIGGQQLVALVKVALRKESVDRNRHGGLVLVVVAASLSARRAWIEIMILA